VVWEQDARVIVMLTAESEGGQLKCHSYWKPGNYGTLQLKMLAERQVPLETKSDNRISSSSPPHSDRPVVGPRRSTNPHTAAEKKNLTQPLSDANGEAPHIRIRHFALSDTSSPFQPIREITQLQYSHWPDFGTPAHPTHILQLIDQCDRAAMATSSPGSTFEPETPAVEKQRPVIVHCSAGCGRTGTFCTVDSVIDMLKRQRSSKVMSPIPGADINWDRNQDVDLIAKTVEDFRLQRLSMVQSLRQFVLCYESILEWIVSQSPPPSKVVIPSSSSSSSSSRLHSLKREEARRSYHG
jgi:protein tyrosine phosphatase